MLYEFDHQQITLSATDSCGATDERLMESIKSGDASALEVLHRAHRAVLGTVIRRIVNNDADADEVLQDCFIEIWRRADTYDEAKGKVLGWAITMARRRAIDRVRRRMCYARVGERFAEQRAETEDGFRHVQEDAQSSDCARALKVAMERLPKAQRLALQMSFYQGLSQREIAATTGTPLGTVKTRLELGLKKIKAALLAAATVEEWT